jgi:hypothetical protein
MYINMPRN